MPVVSLAREVQDKTNPAASSDQSSAKPLPIEIPAAVAAVAQANVSAPAPSREDRVRNYSQTSRPHPQHQGAPNAAGVTLSAFAVSELARVAPQKSSSVSVEEEDDDEQPGQPRRMPAVAAPDPNPIGETQDGEAQGEKDQEETPSDFAPSAPPLSARHKAAASAPELDDDDDDVVEGYVEQPGRSRCAAAMAPKQRVADRDHIETDNKDNTTAASAPDLEESDNKDNVTVVSAPDQEIPANLLALVKDLEVELMDLNVSRKASDRAKDRLRNIVFKMYQLIDLDPSLPVLLKNDPTFKELQKKFNSLAEDQSVCFAKPLQRGSGTKKYLNNFFTTIFRPNFQTRKEFFKWHFDKIIKCLDQLKDPKYGTYSDHQETLNTQFLLLQRCQHACVFFDEAFYLSLNYLIRNASKFPDSGTLWENIIEQNKKHLQNSLNAALQQRNIDQARNALHLMRKSFFFTNLEIQHYVTQIHEEFH